MADDAFGFIEYRLNGEGMAPSWAKPSPFGRLGYAYSWDVAFGGVENQFAQQTLLAVQARFPSLAPMDANGTTSQALSEIGLNNALLPTFGDNARLDRYRAWLQTGFSPLAAGTTAPWFPSTTYAAGQKVGTPTTGGLASNNFASGLAWLCTVGGESSETFPFPTLATLGQVVTDGTAVWKWAGETISQTTINATPPNPRAPGYYYAGTSVGLIAALMNSGFYAVATDGTIIPPRIYNERDFFNVTNTTAGGWDFAGSSSTTQVFTIACSSSGTAGSSGTISFHSGTTTPATWTASTDYAKGTFVASAHGDIFYAANDGRSGGPNPFPGSTPTASTWPPTAGMSLIDNTIQWIYATFSPIPLVVPIGPSYGLNFAGSFTGSTGTTLTYTPSPPDGRTDAWARLWLVLPLSNRVSGPLEWGGDPSSPTAGEFGGYWGGAPAGFSFPAQWGDTGEEPGQLSYGLVGSIVQRWLPAHTWFVGAWVVEGTDTALDSIPASPWSELDVTIGGIQVPFWRFGQELP